MDLGETGSHIIIGIIIFLLLAFNIYIKSRRTVKTPLGQVISILMNVNHNEKLVENFSFHRGAGKLKTSAWKKHKDKVDFLPQELWMTLSQAFEMSDAVNERIDAARKFKSDSYMAGIDVSKLKAPLAESKQRLQEWLQANMQNPEYAPKRRGLFG
jgi:hypothetical protein